MEAAFSKFFPEVGISTYASVNYSEWDEAINFPFGGGLMWIWLEQAGVSFHGGF